MTVPAARQIVLPADAGALADRVRALRSRGGRGRVIVGITGAPGAGKSRLAAAVVDELGAAQAVVIGMDGFHLAQRVLSERGLTAIKGAPGTFDGAGYVALMARIAAREPMVYAPEFRREIEEPVAGAIAVPAAVPIVITEGNYLLLTEPPWDALRATLTETWYLDTPEPLRLQRLIDRHVAYGRDRPAATERAVAGSDARNAELIVAGRHRADVLVLPAPGR